MAVTSQRDTLERLHADSEYHEIQGADSTTFIKGALACINSSGKLVMASKAAGLIAVGRCEENYTTGVSNTRKIRVKTGTFKWKNTGGNAVVQASLGETCWIEDNETVRLANDTSSQAGVVQEVESDGVWVKTRYPNHIAAVVGT